MSKRKAILNATVAALVILGAALCAAAQDKGAAKQNRRDEAAKVVPTVRSAPTDDATYAYEFRQPDFVVRRVSLSHDADGRGQISFERRGDIEPVVEPLELSDSSLARITALWEALRFLDSDKNYQAERHYAHLGTVHLKMTRGERIRDAEFDWTEDESAKALANEYRRVVNQAVFVFEVMLARQNQPLESPKLLDRLDRYLKLGEISDPRQLLPLLRELVTDERLPLMSRNHAARIVKKLESDSKN